ncbi:hypothetical protein BZG36_00056 [Bifiguratus adelaidae]|uniref:protein-tyrosine-phosphatase n=1 Tax=Bifiguratus adelaidae TaxID=1938954 RepID=A0A261Y8F4_9FUNG|nr:hypothetical protein BZG36_00056 [Bifiguratus adelaidae]
MVLQQSPSSGGSRDGYFGLPAKEEPASTPYYTAPLSPSAQYKDFYKALQVSQQTLDTPFNPAASSPSRHSPHVSAQVKEQVNHAWKKVSGAFTLEAMELDTSNLHFRRKAGLAGTPPGTTTPGTAASKSQQKLQGLSSQQLADEILGNTPHPLKPLEESTTTHPRYEHALETFAHPLLILDLRSFMHYTNRHIRQSVNVCIPSTILRRKTFTLDKLASVVANESKDAGTQGPQLSQWRETANIVMLDVASWEIVQDSPADLIAKKLKAEGYGGFIGYLEGGFESFIAEHADLCEGAHTPSQIPTDHHASKELATRRTSLVPDLSKLRLDPSKLSTLESITQLRSPGLPQIPLDPAGITVTPPPQRRPQLSMRSLLGPLTAPMRTPAFENQAFNPFFSNIRQNMELGSGKITERFSVRLPVGIHVGNDGQVTLCPPEETPNDRQAEVLKQFRWTKLSDNTPIGIDQFSGQYVPIAVKHVRGTGDAEDAYKGQHLPPWLALATRQPSPNSKLDGPSMLADFYEGIERAEQRRLQSVMLHHSKSHSGSPQLQDHLLSIIAGIEKGALNRYNNLWPYEYTRVKLQHPVAGKSDYINASMIENHAWGLARHMLPAHMLGLEEPSDPPASHSSSADRLPVSIDSKDRGPFGRYIATQGPLPTTFEDFWTMCWEQQVHALVMLTKETEMGRIKCHRYWPSTTAQPETYGQYKVRLISERKVACRKDQQVSQDVPVPEEGSFFGPVDDDFKDDIVIVRELELTHHHSTRRLTHFQYTGWPDFGVPDDPIGVLMLYELLHERPIQGPVLVHCSAGCGRTGAFCAIDTTLGWLQQSRQESLDTASDLVSELDAGHVNLLAHVIERYREQRISMVQTLRQYVFCFEAVVWWTIM